MLLGRVVRWLFVSTSCMHANANARCGAAFELSLLLVLSSLLVLYTLRLRLFYGDFSRTGAPALYTHAL